MNIEAKVDRADFQTGDVLIVSSAHAVNDTYTGFLPALLPVLIEKFSLSNTAAGALSLGMQRSRYFTFGWCNFIKSNSYRRFSFRYLKNDRNAFT